MLISSLPQNSACDCSVPNQVCISETCVCDIGFTPDNNGNCQPAPGMYPNQSVLKFCQSTYLYFYKHVKMQKKKILLWKLNPKVSISAQGLKPFSLVLYFGLVSYAKMGDSAEMAKSFVLMR